MLCRRLLLLHTFRAAAAALLFLPLPLTLPHPLPPPPIHPNPAHKFLRVMLLIPFASSVSLRRFQHPSLAVGGSLPHANDTGFHVIPILNPGTSVCREAGAGGRAGHNWHVEALCVARRGKGGGKLSGDNAHKTNDERSVPDPGPGPCTVASNALQHVFPSQPSLPLTHTHTRVKVT